ncbi:MAG: signal peptide peptidase SppA [Candidatus Tectomicrobia bacterium]|nr:signal peptide peptidase SppA [Candidatus Tectomicrobia bacterium]
MKRFLRRLAIAAVSWLVVLAIGYLVLYVLFLAPPRIADHSILHVALAGDLPEEPTSSMVARLLRPEELSLADVLDSLRLAQRDPRIEAVFLEIGDLQTGWAKVEEVSEALDSLRRAGKFIAAFLPTAEEKEYLLASAADHVSLAPAGHLLLNGLTASVTFLRDLLAKVGIQPTIVRIGQYKTAADPLVRSSMSPAEREQLGANLDDVFERFLERVAERRGLSSRDVLQFVNAGSYRPEPALGARLIDAVEYHDQVLARLGQRLGRADPRAALVPLAVYRRAPPAVPGPAPRRTVAIVYGSGIIVSGKRSFAPGVGKLLGADSFAETLQRAARDETVAAIIVRLDSPGGSALASDLLWRDIHRARQRKPVVASMSDVAASGGYYLAMAAERIVAQPSTLTGSIGILAAKLNNQDLYQRLGISREVLARGTYAAAEDESRPFTKEELEQFRRDIERGYAIFAQKAAQDRGMSLEALDAVAQGRVWTGKLAYAVGLVDVLGGLQEAVAEAKRLAKIPPDETVRLVTFAPPEPLLQSLLLENLTVSRLAGALLPIVSEGAWRALGSVPRLLANLLREPLALMPVWVEID